MLKVLVVDDSATQAAMIAHDLQQRNCTVEISPNGTTGLTRAFQENFDLLIVDLNLPDINGLQMCVQYKTAGGQSPVLIASSADKLHSVDPTTPFGADYYCVKDSAVLAVRVETIFLRRRRATANCV